MTPEEKNDAIIAMRERSGNIRIDNSLVEFIYILVRDHLPLGVIEDILSENVCGAPVLYTNGWLARYAQDVAIRLTNDKVK